MTNEQSGGVSGALLVSLVPAIGYGMAYLHEFAYCSAFDIPHAFIEVSLSTALAVTATLLGSLAILVWLIDMASIVFYPEILGSPKGRAVVQALLVIAYAVFVVILLRPEHAIWYVCGASLLAVFFHLIFPLLTNWRASGYETKLEKQEEIEREFVPLSSRILRQLPVPLRTVVLIAIVCLLGAYLDGRGDAGTQKKFLVPESHPGKVVLRRYSDILILATFDRSAHEVAPEFSFVVAASPDIADAVAYRLEAVGPLEMK